MRMNSSLEREPLRPGSLHVVHLVSELARGGTERLLFDLLMHLDAARFRVTVASTGSNGSPEMLRHFEGAGLRCVQLPCRLPEHAGHGWSPRHALGKLRALHRLVTALRELRPDIVHTHGAANNLHGAVAARLAGVRRVVAHDHNPVARGLRDRLGANLLAASCDTTCAASRTVRDARRALLVAGSHRVVHVPNGIDLNRFRPATAAQRRAARQLLGVPAGAFVIGCVGRLVPFKRHALLLDSMARVLAEVPQAHLLLVGEGPERARLEERAARLGLVDRVRWAGWQEDARHAYWAMDAFAIPSDEREGFGLVAAEAMACALPVVATRMPLFAEILDTQAACLVEPHPQSIADALVQLARYAAERRARGLLGRAHARRWFDIERSARRLEGLYRTHGARSAAGARRFVGAGRHEWAEHPITGGDRYMHEVAAACRELGRWDLLREPTMPARFQRCAWLRAGFHALLVLWYLGRLPRLRGRVLVHDLTNRAHMGLVSWMARVLFRNRIVAVVQGIYHHDGIPRRQRMLEALLARLDLQAAHLVLANSEATRDAIAALGVAPRKVRIVHPGIEAEFLRPPGPRSRPRPGQLRVLFVAGQCKQIKGLDTLVEALGMLATPRLHVTLVGECDGPTCGPYVAALQARARALGVERQLHFAGRTSSHGALRDIYLRHDVLVLPSLWEGYGMSVLEAMASGLPAIVSERGGAAALVQAERTGLHVTPGDAADLAHALYRFLADPGLAPRMGRRALRHAPRLAQAWPETRAALRESLQQAFVGPQHAGGERESARASLGRCSSIRDGERVLFVECEGVGDASVLLPALDALAASFPNARFDVLASPACAGVLQLVRGLGAVHVAGSRRALLLQIWRLRRRRYDWAVVASPLLRYQLLAACCGARRTAGFDVGRRRGGLLHVTVPWSTVLHQVERRLQLAAALGARPACFVPQVSDAARLRVRALLDRLAGPGPLVVLHTRCMQPCNAWLDLRWMRVGRQLRKRHAARLVLIGSAAERRGLQPLASALCGSHLAAGDLSIEETFELLRHADLLVTLDTGVMHLGSLADIPTVVLLGGRNPAGEWAPRHAAAEVLRHEVECSPCRSRTCRSGAQRCMYGIGTEAVLEAAARVLTANRARAREA